MKTFSLQSGSNGNAIYVETMGVRLLFDAGISGRQAELRMAQHGRDIRSVDAVIISHDHRDHIQCAGIYHRKFHLPIYVTERTFQSSRANLGKMLGLQHFNSGQPLEFGEVRVHTVRTPHDGVDGVCFIVEGPEGRLGILTDLGHVFEDLFDVVRDLDAVYLESNYDPNMLEHSDYPEFLKDRIQGDGGHLSNGEASDLIGSIDGLRLQWVALSHLSGENNSPRLALQTMKRTVGTSFPVHIASRYEVSSMFEV